MIDVQQRYAVLGQPVINSRSPLIFNTMFSYLEIPAYYSRLTAGSGLEALDMFKGLNLNGMNITAPFKSELLSLIPEAEEPARMIGGINTVVAEDGILRGYNTDHLGVEQSLLTENVEIANKSCVVLGAGGAGRAAVYALHRRGGNVTIVNRTYEKAQAFAGTMGCRAVQLKKLKHEISECDILVSTLASGVNPIKKDWLKESTVVFDANYTHSLLAEMSLTRGCRLIRGEQWLFNQALPAFHLFTKKDLKRTDAVDLINSITDVEPDFSHLVLLGAKYRIENIKKKFIEAGKKMGITKISGFTDIHDYISQKETFFLKKNPVRILIYSGSDKDQRSFFPHSDLVVWGKCKDSEVIERIQKEFDHVR